jgi:hypothetical protein
VFRGYGQVTLPDEFADPRPRDAAQVQQANPSVSKIVRREERNSRRLASLPDGSS